MDVTKGEERGSFQWRRIILVAAILFVAMFCLTLPVAQLDKFMRRLVPPEAAAYENTLKTLFATVYFLAYIIFALFWGALSDRIGRRKPFIAIGLLGSAVMYLATTIVQELPLLYLVRFIDGNFSVMAVSLLMTVGLDIAPRHRVGMTMGILTLTMFLGNAAGAPLGGLLGNVSISFPFYLGSGLFLLGTILVLLLPEAPIETRPSTLGEALSLLVEERRLAIPYAYSFAERFTVGFFIGVFPVLMAAKFGASPGRIGMLQAAFLVLLALLSPLGGFLSDRWGRAWPLVTATVFYGVVLWGVGLVGESALFVVMALGGLSGAILYPATVALTGDLAPADKRGVAMGGFNTFGSVGMALGPVLLGFVGDVMGLSASSAVAGLTCIVVALASLPFLLRMRAAAPARL